MFVWSGKGHVVVSAGAVSIALMMFIDQRILPPGHRMWPLSIAHVLAGLCCLALGLSARWGPPRIAIEPETGRDRMVRPKRCAESLRSRSAPGAEVGRHGRWCARIANREHPLDLVGPQRAAGDGLAGAG